MQPQATMHDKPQSVIETGTRKKHIPLPTNYRKARKYVQMAVEERRNIDSLLEQDRHFRTGRTIVGRVLCNLPKIDAIYSQLDLATKEPGLTPWVARVLISELLYGSGRLVSNAPAVECIRKYEEQLRTLHAAVEQTSVECTGTKGVSFTIPRFVRINTNLLSIPDAKSILAQENWTLVEEKFDDYRAFLARVKALSQSEYIEDFHFPEMLVFPNGAKQFWGRARHLRDQFILQNKVRVSAVTYLLRPRKKSVVLDMCAAPGLKTTHLATLMKNKGRIYAVERNSDRYATLTQMVSSYGVIKTIHGDCLTVTDADVPGVEYILVDPSCSGSGMHQRLYEKEQQDEQRLHKLAGLQYKILSHAMNEFRNARRIVYSTCSISTTENEEVVHGVLRHNGHFRLLDARQELGKEWLNVGSPDFVGIGERCLYARTDDDLTIGMFVAVFERCPEGVLNEVYLAHEKQKQSYERLALMRCKQPVLDVINDEDWRPEAPFAGKRKVATMEQPTHDQVTEESAGKKLKSKHTDEQVEEKLAGKKSKKGGKTKLPE
uniref:SAM-dependent MTase RsmB/NOP-type domain-containing protein n=1 Tax=Anopheles maculatus TaxID=74869 RepID=A0A182TAC1_9DIPT